MGDGLSELDGKPIFVPKSTAGDVLRVKILSNTRDNIRAEIAEILNAGPDRITAPCPHYANCGGCSLMHLSPPAYEAFKRRQFQNALHHAGFSDYPAEVVFLGIATRRRVELKVKNGALGFFKQRSHELVPIEQCIVTEKKINEIIKTLVERVSDLTNIDAISITVADSGVDIVLSTTSPTLSPNIHAIFDVLAINRLTIWPQAGAPYTIFEKAAVTMQLGDQAIALPPDAFLQATREGQRLLTEFVIKQVGHASRIADLFCGIGTYSFPLNQKAQVHAVELDVSMVAALKKAAAGSTSPHRLTSEARDLFTRPLLASELNKFEALVINPPRMGAKAQTLEIAKSHVKAVVMISCSPASWARDAKILKEAGYKLTCAIAIDQFVYSPHFEIASVFIKDVQSHS